MDNLLFWGGTIFLAIATLLFFLAIAIDEYRHRNDSGHNDI